MSEPNILLVDDEFEFVEKLAERLRLRGFNTQVVSNGVDALACLRRQQFQSVVLDVMMPGMDGLETLKQIKRLDSSVEVILLTGHARTEAALAGVQAGAFDYLIKPVDIDELAFRLEDACEKQGLCLAAKRGTSESVYYQPLK